MNNLLAADGIPGMAVAITYDGQVVLDQGYGVTGDTAKTPVTADTTFQVGSVTKTFTAISILMIAQDPSLIDTSTNPGITSLDLDSPIKTYLQSGVAIPLPSLPSGQTFTLPTEWADVTTRQMLDMSSGLPDNLNYTPWNQLINDLIQSGQTGPVFSPPGSRYLYSNEGFQVLGALIEKLTDVGYAPFVQQHILTPLGMTDTQVLTGAETRVPGEAIGFNTYKPATNTGTRSKNYSGASASSAGAILSSADDLGKYMSALWNESSLLLSASSYQEMWTPVPLVSFKHPPTIITPGLGWDGVDRTPNGTLIWKNGAVPGYQAQISLFEGNGVGVAVALDLTNPFFHSGNVPVGEIVNIIHAAVDTAEVSGHVTNGVGGTPLRGWRVELVANSAGQAALGALSRTTNAKGFYSFPNAPPGEFTLKLVPPKSGWRPVKPATGTRSLVTVESGVYNNQNFVVDRIVPVA